MESLSHPEIKKDWQQIITRIDEAFLNRLQRAKNENDLQGDLVPELASKLLQGMLQTIGLRARIGDSPNELVNLARYGVESIISK